MEKKFAVKIPAVPNFIIVGGHSLSITEFSEPELKAIGDDWTRDLIAAARAKRKAQKNEPIDRGSGSDPNPVY